MGVKKKGGPLLVARAPKVVYGGERKRGAGLKRIRKEELGGG